MASPRQKGWRGSTQDHAGVRSHSCTIDERMMLGDFDAAQCLRILTGVAIRIHCGRGDGRSASRSGRRERRIARRAGRRRKRCHATHGRRRRSFRNALELLSGSSDRSTAIAARTQQGAARCWLGNFSEGLTDLNAAVAEAAHSGSGRARQARLELGYHLVGAGREHEGLAILGPALLQAEELGDLRRPADTHERLSALYERALTISLRCPPQALSSKSKLGSTAD